jgi:hypothetical protein
MIPYVPNNDSWIVHSLSFGGYLITNINSSDFTMYGYLFDQDDSKPNSWKFPNQISTNMYGVIQILPHNNTLLVAQSESSNYWQFKVIDLPKFAGDRDQGYSNVNVKATVPVVNSSINRNLSQISIDFYEPVELSDGNLLIYQVTGNQPYLRQLIPSKLCSVIDNKTVVANVLESTFTTSEGSYFIKMDNNFVKDRESKGPLLGIKENVWNFNIEGKKDDTSPSTTGLLRLTSNGTKFFDDNNLSQHDKRDEFFERLLSELSVAVPVDESRLHTDKKVQLDNGVTEKQYLIPIFIKKSINNDNNAVSIIRIIDTMIRNKNQTPIGTDQATIYLGYLDELYGFKQLRKYILISAIIVYTILILFLNSEFLEKKFY